MKGDLYDLKTWEKFLRNATRVQVLTHYLPARYDNEVYRLLGLARPVMHLFPQLHTLYWEDECPEKCQNILLFLGPSLTRLALRNHHGEAIFKVCEAVACRARYLKHLDIPNSRPFALPTWISLTNAIRNLVRLEGLTTLTCDGEFMLLKAFSSLSTLPNLAELKLNTLHLEPFQDLRSIPRLPFLALQVLSLQVKNLSTMVNPFFSSIRAPHLSQFALTINQDETLMEHDIRTIFRALSIRKKLVSITVLANLPPRLRLGASWGSSQNLQDIVNDTTLEPLFKLGDLAKLDLSRSACYISDSTLQRVALQWPLMADLRLGSSCPESVPTATFSGLRAIATGCPHLKTLGIPLDISYPWPSLFATRPSYSCKEFHVLAREPRDPVQVATLLSDILPVANIYSVPVSEGWTAVNKLIRPFAEVRREERQRVERTSPLQPSNQVSLFGTAQIQLHLNARFNF